MRILIVGATGTIGSAVAAALQGRHDLVLASQQKSPEKVRPAAFKPFSELTDADFDFSLRSKLMGQVNLFRLVLDSIADASEAGASTHGRYPCRNSGAGVRGECRRRGNGTSHRTDGVAVDTTIDTSIH